MICAGFSSYRALEERLAIQCKSKSSEGLKEFCEFSLGLSLTIQEFNLFISSLSSDKRSSDSSVMILDGSKAMKALSLMLEEVQIYGYFQQVMFIINSCLSSNPASRPSFRELQTLSLFGLHEEISLLKAGEDSKLLVVPYMHVDDFCNRVLFHPLKECIERALLISSGVNVNDDLDGSVKEFSKVLSVVEELVLLNLDLASGRTDCELNQTLADLGLDLSWLEMNISGVLSCLAKGGVFQAIALFTLRMSSVESLNKVKPSVSASRSSSTR